ncbi:MAG: transposase [Deltaproteobacteria bacterium]|nr:transposase [Deltaproteobacteria bacterium]
MAIRATTPRLEEEYAASFASPPEVLILAIDTTDDPTHGQQQLSFFHGYCDHHTCPVKSPIPENQAADVRLLHGLFSSVESETLTGC